MAIMQNSIDMSSVMNIETKAARLPPVDEYIPTYKDVKEQNGSAVPSFSAVAFLSHLGNTSTKMPRADENMNSFLNENYYLEENWKDIIKEDLGDSERCLQDAIWKFILTERNHMNNLSVLVKHFMALFNASKKDGALPGIDGDELFGNVSEILQANERFWMDFILPTLQNSRRDGSRIIPSQLFTSSSGQTLNFKDMFISYEKYCFRLGEETFLKYVKMILSESESLTEASNSTRKFKRWDRSCSGSLQYDCFSLVELLNEPSLRLSQYVLLLSAILYHSNDHFEIESLASLMEECKSFESGINEKIQERLRQKHLVLCLEDLDERALTEAENEELNCISVKEFLKLPIKSIKPSLPRCILDKTSMKLNTGKKREKVKAFLFSDVLVLTKFINNTKKYKIIEKVYFLDKIHLLKSQESKGLVVLIYLDDFGLLAETFSLELQPGEIDAWILIVKRAKHCYENCIKGKGGIYDFFKHGNSLLQLFHYKKGKLQGSFDDDSEFGPELVFEDEFIQINESEKGNLPCASYTRRKGSSKDQTFDIDKLAINPTKRSRTSSNSVSDRLDSISKKYSHSSSDSITDVLPNDGSQSPNKSPRPDSIICFRQSIGDQATLIDFESNLPCYFLSFYIRDHKYTQTDDDYR